MDRNNTNNTTNNTTNNNNTNNNTPSAPHCHSGGFYCDNEGDGCSGCPWGTQRAGGGFAAHCSGRVGWFDGDHPECCGNCRA